MALTLLFAWTLQTRILAQGDGKYQKKRRVGNSGHNWVARRMAVNETEPPTLVMRCAMPQNLSSQIMPLPWYLCLPLPHGDKAICAPGGVIYIYIYMYIICNYIWKFLRDDKADGHTAKGPLFLRTDDLLQIPSRYWLGSRISSHQKSMRLSLAVSGSATLGTVTEADHNLLVASRMDTIYGSTLVFPKLIVDTLWPAGILTWTWYDSMLR